MARAGRRLVEVGTTNRTHLRDYEQARSATNTGLILKAHTSNYLHPGLHASPCRRRELAALGAIAQGAVRARSGLGRAGGSGALRTGAEPTVAEALAEGADLVTFSGDKLLGGPQAGIIAGAQGAGRARRQEPHEARAAPRQDSPGRARGDPQALSRSRPPRRRRCRRCATSRGRRPRSRRLRPRSCRPSRRRSARGYAGRGRPIARSQIGSGALPLETLPSAGIAIATRRAQGRRPPLGGAGRRLPLPADTGHRPRQGRRARPRPALPRR